MIQQVLKQWKNIRKIMEFHFIHVDLSKDISDSIKDHGAKKVKQYLKEHL